MDSEYPCDCRRCNACAIFGIAYPLARRPPVEPEADRLADAAPSRAERRPAATLFDQLESEER